MLDEIRGRQTALVRDRRETEAHDGHRDQEPERGHQGEAVASHDPPRSGTRIGSCSSGGRVSFAAGKSRISTAAGSTVDDTQLGSQTRWPMTFERYRASRLATDRSSSTR